MELPEITADILHSLKRYDRILRRIGGQDRGGACALLSGEKKELGSIYRQITGVNICSSCSSAWLQRLALWYLKAKARAEEEEEEQSPARPEPPAARPKPKPPVKKTKPAGPEVKKQSRKPESKKK